MSPLLIVIALAILSIAVILDQPSVGIVLSGLLALFWSLSKKLTELGSRIELLENDLANQVTRQSIEKETEGATEPNPKTQSAEPDETSSIPPTGWPQTPDPSPALPPAQLSTTQKETQDVPIPTQQAPQTRTSDQNTLDESETPETQKAPPKPGLITGIIKSLIVKALEWVTGGNLFVRVGIIILFMGMSFLIRFAIGENYIPIELRLAGVALAAIALLAWGWFQREKRNNFALVVQGGGIGLLYLTIFAGFSLYSVIPPTLAFALLGIIVILAAILAVLQDAKSLALFATIGGFLAPILTSSGSNNYIGLFTYYTILNIGIFNIAWFRSWRILNFVGFVCTFAIAGAWGGLSYKPAFFSTTEPFLITFFLLYVAISVLFAYRRSPDFKDYVDSTLIFGAPLLAFAMQCALVQKFEYGIAISAFALALFYITLSYILWKNFSTRLKLLCETFLSLGVIFATLSVPFFIDGTLTGAIWAIEGAGILWVSIKQQQNYRRLFAIALIYAAGVILAAELLVQQNLNGVTDQHAFINGAFISTTLIAIAAACGSWLLSKDFEGKFPIETPLGYTLLGYSFFVLLAGFEYQIAEFNLTNSHGNKLAILSIFVSFAYLWAAKKLDWQLSQRLSLGSISLLVPAALLSFVNQPQLAANYGYFIWPLACFSYFFILNQTRSFIQPMISMAAHIVAASLLIALLFWEGIWQLLLGYSLLTVMFNLFSDKLKWQQLKTCAALFLPVLGISCIAAIAIDGNLIELSSIGSSFSWPFPPGGILWPLAFATYFYVLFANRSVGHPTLHYAGAGLLAAMLLWLGLWALLSGAIILCGLAYYLWRRTAWTEMRIISTALLPIMLLTLICVAVLDFDPLTLPGFNLRLPFVEQLGFILWPLAFAALYFIYWLSDQEQRPARSLQHALGLLLLIWLITWESSWLALESVPFYNAWHIALLPIFTLAAITLILEAKHWPFNKHKDGYHRLALPPLAAVTIVWSFVQLKSSGSAEQFPWFPLLNPIDIIQTLLVIGWIWYSDALIKRLPYQFSTKHYLFALLGFIFLWINVDLLRAIHHWANLEWNFYQLISADISQTSLSLLWAILGLIVIFYATRNSHRQLWMSGTALLGVVVLKLFIVDLAAQQTIERIVSFTGVGLLLTLVGYFSPLPPKTKVDQV